MPVAEALAQICENLPPLPSEPCNVTEARGRYLAEDVVAGLSHPAAHISAMDGYAIAASSGLDAGTVYSVIGEAAAGAPFAGDLGPAEAIRIFTGAYLCTGADTILIQEEIETRPDGQISITQTARAEQFVRPQGLDFSTGNRLLPAGKCLTARDIALAALAGCSTLMVRKRPHIGILSSGDELVSPGERPQTGQLINSNSLFLHQLVTLSGGIAIDLGIIRDTPGALITAVKAAGPLDLLVTTGGASVGDHDHIVSDIMAADGGQIDFWKIAMRPGKPLIFGKIGNTPLLGLPGNPVSAGVCGLVFLQPALRSMLSASLTLAQPSATLATPLPENDRRQDYLRACFITQDDGSLAVTPAPQQDSSMLQTFTHADCLIIRPPHAPVAPNGTIVPILPFPVGI
jgi:molybdopterin molybdotransferase